jgi:hypothetical protein
MAVVQPFNSQWRDYLNIAPGSTNGSASFNAAWIDARKAREMFVHFAWTAVASTNAVFTIQGSEDPSLLDATAVTLTPTVIHGNAASLTLGATASAAIAMIEYIPSYMRVVYTRTAGGGANQLSVYLMGRAT